MKMLTSPASISTRESGYTLLELLVVVAIISMAVALVPNVYARMVPSYHVRQFSNELVNVARGLREAAMRERKVTWLAIREEHKTLELSDGFLKSPSGVVLTFSDDEAIELNADNTIYFYPNGMSSGGKIVVLRDAYSATIAIDWISGAIGIRS